MLIATWLSPFVVNTAPAAGSAQIVGRSDGSILVAWVQAGPGPESSAVQLFGCPPWHRVRPRGISTCPPARGAALTYRVSSETGNAIVLERLTVDLSSKPPLVLARANSERGLVHPTLAVDLRTGSVLTGFVAYDAVESHMLGRAASGAIFPVGANTGDLEFDPNLAVLTHGRCVAVYEGTDPDVNGVEARIFSLQDTPRP